MCYYIVNKNNTDWCKAPEQEKKMRTLYRLVYKNGDHGAWDDDIDRIRKYAKFFHAEIEIKNDGGYFGTVPSEVITERIKKA